MSSRIDTVAARARLKARYAPYFQRIISGVFVGYRKMSEGAVGSWWIRVRDEETGKQTSKGLGKLDHLPDCDRYMAAFKQAKDFHDHAQAGGVTEDKTVADACSAYVAHIRAKKGDKAADDIARRFNTYVLDDSRFAALELRTLKPAQVGDWRQRLTDRPIHRGSGHSKTGSKSTDKKRSPSSLNRDMTPFRAALNYALSEAWVTNDFAWRSKLKPIASADRQRAGGYLTRDQRQLLIDTAEEQGSGVHVLIRVLCALPVRPGALVQLRVKNYNAATNELSITLDKTGPRKILLPASVAGVFADACKSKLPEALIFAQPDGVAWDKDAWKHPFKRAVLTAKLPESVVMYSLRHCTLTDMIAAGVDLLTVSRLSGTSIAMLQAHYGHLIPHVGMDAIAAVAI